MVEPMTRRLLEAEVDSGPDDLVHAYPDLADVPRAVLENVGAYDTDCAGGCG